MTDIRQIPIKFIRTNGKTQVRMAMDQGAILEYAEAMKEGVTFPPVVLFLDKDIYWLGDGFHRVEAAQAAGKKNIKADVRQGGLREAQFFAIGANHDHGLRRSNADKRKAVEMLLDDPEWGGWSNREIARVAGVAPGLVDKMKGERVPTVGTPAPKSTPQKAAALPPLPDELLNFDSWDEEDAGDEFGRRVEALAKKTGEGTDEGFDAWGEAWDADHKDAFTRLLVAESWPGIFKVPTDLERDAWLAKHLPAPTVGERAAAMEAGATEQVCGVPEATRPVSPYVDEAQLHPAAPVIPLKAAPLPPGPDDRDSRIAQLERLVQEKDAALAELTRQLEEAGAQVQELNDENQAMHRILDAEDLLTAFKKEVTRAQALARTTEERFRGMQNQNKALSKSATSWKRKFDALERKTKGAPEPDPELEEENPYPPEAV